MWQSAFRDAGSSSVSQIIARISRPEFCFQWEGGDAFVLCVLTLRSARCAVR
jgi:hypothetical protein